MDNNLSDLIDQLSILRADKKRAEYEVKQINKKIEVLDKTLMDAMDDLGILESKNGTGKVSIQESVYPHVEQWEQFGEWILDNRYLHFLERRPAVLSYREALTMGKPVPGVLPFTKRKIAFRGN